MSRKGTFLHLIRVPLFAAVFFVCFATFATAAVITFSGGQATLDDASVVTTDDSTLYSNVDYYEEAGFVFDFIETTGEVGNYYDMALCGGASAGAVIHWHPADGYTIRIRRADDQPFDFNGLSITSNTEAGGGAATGNEVTVATTSNGDSVTLPPSDWGVDFLSTCDPGDGVINYTFGPEFENVTYVDISSTDVFCFGMDEFYIDEEPPYAGPTAAIPTLSEWGMIALSILLGISAILYIRRQRMEL